MATARPDAADEDKVIEVWEAVTASVVSVYTWDRRTGDYGRSKVGGSGTKRLEISRDCRKYNQSLIPDENIHLDPFTNGSLRLVSCSTEDETLVRKYHLQDVDLLEYFKFETEKAFIEAIEDIDSEVILRRLLALSETQGRMWHVDALRKLVSERYPVGGMQRTVREIEEAESRVAG